MTVDSDLIASLVQREFGKLPTKRKPVIRDNGLHEWVPLSGIVSEEKDGRLTCLALATGMKCLPSSKLPQAQGNVLHDWHAEVLAIRAFNCFVLDECRALASGSKSSSPFIRRRDGAEIAAIPNSVELHNGDENWHSQPFAWREDVILHMYCSEAPCGDASMELTMASQEDATPWSIPVVPQQETLSIPSIVPDSAPDTLLPGRAYFSQLGIVRRKPSRGDAPSTLSKSCSDKLSLHQCMSLLSSPTSLLVSPEHAYISTLILPTSQYSASGCKRAFSDGQGEKDAGSQQARMAPLVAQDSNGNQGGGYNFRPFTVKTTDIEFAYSRRAASNPQEPNSTPTVKPKITPSNLAVALTASNRVETTLNGVLQGHKASQAHIRGSSFTSRRRLWSSAVEVASLLPLANAQDIGSIQPVQQALGVPISAGTRAKTYRDLKGSSLLEPRRRAKQAARDLALKGWVRNIGDEDFVL
ncbi:adenosine deaminase/editase [Xylaria bambusicola]|uniref:adenosine deaminase/editase n=1 Tax=Xylaria bambusicola TaxID=326684 RepID=UPI002007C2D0|nr:adenosine deaminase/editase [Xylaria bambusicola]KAI0509229.1 adenosine deaminase/editase [Xylaria bambusicola]